jgi:hypothetical protein
MITVAVRDRMLRMSHRRVDVSSASTWKDTDDVDLVKLFTLYIFKLQSFIQHRKFLDFLLYIDNNIFFIKHNV